MQDYFGPGLRSLHFHDHGKSPEHLFSIWNMTISNKNGKVAVQGDG
jgi:hypothetical protein